MKTMLAGKMAIDVQNPSAFAMKEVPVPEAGPGEVRVKVGAAGVCLSDVHMIAGLRSPRMLAQNAGQDRTLGHEVAGWIDQIGPSVSGWSEGDRVTLQAVRYLPHGIDTMGVDYDGGWAPYVLVPADVLVKIPDNMPFDQACIIPDAVSTPWAAICETGKVEAGEAAGVWGVGGLGVHAIQLLRMIGAAPVIAVDPLEAARDRALARGADAALDPTAPDFAKALRKANGGRGLDVAFDLAGFEGIPEQAIDVLNPGGRLVITGISGKPITITDNVTFIGAQHKVLGHYGYLPKHVPQLVRLAALDRLDLSGSISDHLPLAQAPEAVRRLEEKDGDPIRLILVPEGV